MILILNPPMIKKLVFKKASVKGPGNTGPFI